MKILKLLIDRITRFTKIQNIHYIPEVLKLLS